jgi:hypothetical protein
MSTRTCAQLLIVALAALAPGARAHAQQMFAEAEPNDAGEAATSVTIKPGQGVTGTTTGSAAGAGAASADWFLLNISGIGAEIVRHRLALTTTGPGGHTGAIMAHRVVAGAVQPGLFNVQSSSVNSVPARFNQFYTVGVMRAEVMLRVTGTASTTQPYRVTLSSEQVTPETLGRTFKAPVTVRTDARGHTTNTEMLVFRSTDGELLRHVDDLPDPDGPGGPGVAPAQAQVTLTQTGRYYVAIGPWQTGGPGLPEAIDGSQDAILTSKQGDVTTGLIVQSSSSAGSAGDLSYRVADSAQQVLDRVASKPGSYGVHFLVLDVSCSIADLAGPGQSPGPDGALTADDIIVYIARFSAGDLRADLAGNAQTPTPDGVLTADDIIAYINRWFVGCTP